MTVHVGEMGTPGIWDAASGSILKSITAHPKSAVLEAHCQSAASFA
jgi:hypothetical protein